jgi:hypothetical protein
MDADTALNILTSPEPAAGTFQHTDTPNRVTPWSRIGDGDYANRVTYAKRHGVELQRLNYNHSDAVDALVQDPTISVKELAARYGYSAGWMSQVVNSDAFQAQLAKRRAELIDPTLQLTLNERFRALTVRSLDVLQEKLHAPIEQISDKLALEAVSLGAKALGLGTPQPAARPDTSDHLAGLAHRLLDLQGARRPAADVVDVTLSQEPAQ